MRPRSVEGCSEGATPPDSPSRLVYPREAGALPLLPVLLELGRASGGDRLCVLVPDDLEAQAEELLRDALCAALREAARSPRTTFLIGLSSLADRSPGRSRLVLDPASGRDSSRPLEALLPPASGPENVLPRREVVGASGFIVGRLSALLALYKDFLPGAFLALVQAWLSGRIEPALASLPMADVDRDLLCPALRRLRVVVARG